MKVEIDRDYGPFDSLVLIPPELQPAHVLRRGHLIKETLGVDLDIAFRLIAEIEQLEAWKLTGETRESFFRFVCGVDPDNELPRLREGFAIMRGKGIAGPITREQATDQARQEAEERPQGKHQSHLNIEMKTAGASYRLRRLARLKPDVLDRYERGEFPSVDAAYRHAFALDDLRQAWKRAAPNDRVTFRAEIADD